MNNTFSFKRFALSFRRLMVERGIKMFGSIFAIIGISVLFMNIQFSPAFYATSQQIFLALGAMFGPILYMFVASNEFSNYSKGVSFLLIPNSRLEKWLMNSVVVVALYYLVYGLLFRLVDLWMIGRLNRAFDLDETSLQPITFDSEIFMVSSLVGASISLGVLLGAYYFKKNSLIASLMIMFGLMLFIFIADYTFANYLFDGNVFFGDSAPFSNVYVTDPETAAGRYLLELDLTPKQLISAIFVPIIVMLSLTYFVRLKEKQL